MNSSSIVEPRKWVQSLVEDLLENCKQNRLFTDSDERIWDKPLVGVSRGDDPYFRFLKEDIGDFYWLPEDAFATEYRDYAVSPAQLAIVCWVLPHTKVTRREHRKQTKYPCERWSRSRLYGEEVNNYLRGEVRDALIEAGFPAVSPMLLPEFRRTDSGKYGYASSWSERHTAFVSGLGTFGLSDGLITPLGKSIRVGSVIAKIDIEPDPRPYESHNEYCLYFYDKSCQKCVDRCPVGAINEEAGHDKVACSEYIRLKTTPYNLSEYNLEIKGCGLCQVKIPCEFGIPARKRKHEATAD